MADSAQDAFFGEAAAQPSDTGAGALPETLLEELAIHLVKHEPRLASLAAQVCQSWRAAFCADWLWRSRAEAVYPADTLIVRPEAEPGRGYRTYKALVQDGNTRNVALRLNIGPLSAPWRHNSDEMFYMYRVLSAEMCLRDKPYIRLAVDARGEADLRPAASSVLTLTASHVGVQTADLACAVIEQALPSRQFVIDSQPGHEKVILEWDMSALSSMERVSRPSTGEPVSWRLSFCYAEADLHQGYEEVTLLSGQAPATKSDQNAVSAARGVIARAWRDASSVVAPGDLEASLLSQTDSEDLTVWQGLVPEYMTARMEEWYKPTAPRPEEPAWKPVPMQPDAWALGQEWMMGQAGPWHADEADPDLAAEQAADWHYAEWAAEDGDVAAYMEGMNSGDEEAAWDDGAGGLESEGIDPDADGAVYYPDDTGMGEGEDGEGFDA